MAVGGWSRQALSKERLTWVSGVEKRFTGREVRAGGEISRLQQLVALPGPGWRGCGDRTVSDESRGQQTLTVELWTFRSP